MKNSDRLKLTVLSLLLAFSLQARPLWWGVLFPSITEDLAMSASADDSGLCWRSGDNILRFRSLDLLIQFLLQLRR